MHLTDDQVFTDLLPQWRASPLWFKQEAARSIDAGRFRFIHGRQDRDIYVVRTWLVPPVPVTDSRGEEVFSSANAVMLHFFPRGDDDKALHNHPWSFRTTILQGWYDEHLPPGDWRPQLECGPAWDRNIRRRRVGDTMIRQADDLHCVGEVADDTWTLVRTGPKASSWGFHPPGKPFMRWTAYLDALKQQKNVSFGAFSGNTPENKREQA